MLILGLTKVQALFIVMGLIAFTSPISTLSALWGVLVPIMSCFINGPMRPVTVRKNGPAASSANVDEMPILGSSGTSSVILVAYAQLAYIQGL